jgi:hypothetical protein
LAKVNKLLSYPDLFLPNQYGSRRLFLHLITPTDTHTHDHTHTLGGLP